ncbi:MAG: DUF998 domain-containing protein [Aquimonas sp.]|nr:DUF998 domain-containing protein [Aquimonas sp.]
MHDSTRRWDAVMACACDWRFLTIFLAKLNNWVGAMDKKDSLLWCGFAAPLWFFAVLLVVGGATPGHNHATHAVSELGALGAPWAFAVNLLMMVGTGALIGLFAIGWRHASPLSGAGWRGLLFSALLFIGIGVPITVVDGSPDMSTINTQVHLMFVLLSPLPWLAVVGAAIVRFHRLGWTWAAVACALTLAAFVLIMVAQVAQVLPDAPGWLQRAGIGLYLGWHAVLALVLLGRRSVARGSRPGRMAR